jgi:protein-tyrosine phosphatase
VGSLVVVDGSGVCRAPIVAFTLQERFRTSGWLSEVPVLTRGLFAAEGRTMCEAASSRLGFTGPALGFYGAHRAAALMVADIADADLVLTAERAQRSSVVRMLPGTQATVFTWKEALVLSSVMVERRRTGALAAPADLPSLARALHGARGTVPLAEPVVRTGVFHWRRGDEIDPLSIQSGHAGAPEHRRVTQESADVAAALGARLDALAHEVVQDAMLEVTPVRGRRVRRIA